MKLQSEISIFSYENGIPCSYVQDLIATRSFKWEQNIEEAPEADPGWGRSGVTCFFNTLKTVASIPTLAETKQRDSILSQSVTQ